MNVRYTRRKAWANKEKLEKVTEKLIKSIRFEVEVQKNIAQTVAELHKKRLKELQKCLD